MKCDGEDYLQLRALVKPNYYQASVGGKAFFKLIHKTDSYTSRGDKRVMSEAEVESNDADFFNQHVAVL
jgi:hypothetical protein